MPRQLPGPCQQGHPALLLPWGPAALRQDRAFPNPDGQLCKLCFPNRLGLRLRPVVTCNWGSQLLLSSLRLTRPWGPARLGHPAAGPGVQVMGVLALFPSQGGDREAQLLFLEEGKARPRLDL